MEIILKTNAISKVFGSKTAVNAVNMTVERGDIYGFIGKNGAGKTTLMKMALGLTTPTSGSYELFGEENSVVQRRRVGSLIEIPVFYKNRTAYENMKRFAILCGSTDEEIKEKLEFVGLGDVGKKKTKNFSLGMKQRLGIAMALLGDPEFLILDEPVNGLDPEGIKHIRDLILKLNREKGVTFLVSSHLLDELSKIATKYGVIKDGVLVDEISADELKGKLGTNLKITVSDVEKAVEIIKGLDGISPDDVTVENDVVIVKAESERSADISTALFSGGVIITGLETVGVGMEDYFIEKMGGAV